MTPAAYEAIVVALGVFVGALGVLFAVGAIAAGWLLYRQGADYQRRIDGALAGYRAMVDHALDNAQVRLEQLAATVQAQLTAATTELDMVGADRQRIAAEIQRLTELQLAISKAAPPSADPTRYRPIPGFDGLTLEQLKRVLRPRSLAELVEDALGNPEVESASAPLSQEKHGND